MTGLRTRRGVDLASLETATGIRVEQRYREVVEMALAGGLLVLEPPHLRATDAGLMRLDALLRSFFAA